MKNGGSMMKAFLYQLWQCTWGFLQTLLGFVVFLGNYRSSHFVYHGAIVTRWASSSSVSLGLFVFVSAEPFFTQKYEGRFSAEELSSRLLVHEYGHTIQSLILGPLYLIVMGIPSTLWGFLGGRMRHEKQIPYGAFFTEKWANRLGERVTGQPSIGNLVLE